MFLDLALILTKFLSILKLSPTVLLALSVGLMGMLNPSSMGRIENDPPVPPTGIEYQSSPTDIAVEAATMPYPAPEIIDWDAREYSDFDENPFFLVANNPFSTFGADVNTASYTNVRSYLHEGELAPKDAVRIEEFLNYFFYEYPMPEGDEVFGVDISLSQTPWNPDTKLLHLGLTTPEPEFENRKPLNFVFLLDVSGSMDYPDKLGLLKSAFSLLVENLNEGDRVSIVTYAGQDQVLLDSVSGDEQTELLATIERLSAWGGTAGSAGIKTAYELAEKNFDPEAENRIILGTDGDLNIGVTSEGELADMVSEKRDTGIFLSVLGFGSDNLKDNKLQALAENGNGEYSYIDDVETARQVMVEGMGGKFQTYAKDVKYQIEFNPETVKGYRLLGYESRVMAAEDFADDTKDGGELGSGHRQTLLYEIVLPDSPMEFPEVPSRYGESEDPVTNGDDGQETDVDPTVESEEEAVVASSEETVAEEAVETEEENADDEPEFIEADFSNEYAVLNIRFKEPLGDTSELLVYPIEKANEVEPDDDTLLASSIAEFALLLKDSEYKADADYDAILERLESITRTSSQIDDLTRMVKQAQMIDEKGPMPEE